MTQVPEGLAGSGIEQVRVLRLEPDDAIVLMTPKRLSMDQQEHILEDVGRLFPAHRVLVLDDGMSVETLRGSAL
ncbi:MAG TPA: hypothetical protein VFU74_22000 [Actinocrinis sp.]|nr:hypothetical protein [Actinocrinis sp.]